MARMMNKAHAVDMSQSGSGGAARRRVRVSSSSSSSNDVECCICGEELSADEAALAMKCCAGHYICAKDETDADRCTTGFVRAQTETSYAPPIKCPVCPAPVVVATFLRFLDDEQAKCHNTRVAVSAMQPGESLLECPKCRYSEITDCPSAEVARLHCKNEGCGSVTCYVCKLEIGRCVTCYIAYVCNN